MRRIRKCDDCGKKLGNTLSLCHNCGGESYRAGGDMTDAWGWTWKVWFFGVDPKKVKRAHDL